MYPKTTFVFNGVKYDTDRFVKARIVFTKIKLDTQPHIYDTKDTPLIDEVLKTPVVTTINGQMVVMACNQCYRDAPNVNQKDFLLVTKHKLKALVYDPGIVYQLSEPQDQPWTRHRDRLGNNPALAPVNKPRAR